jgi:hypothetical protein
MGPVAAVYNPAGTNRPKKKLRGKAKQAFLNRMKRGRAKAARGAAPKRANPKKKYNGAKKKKAAAARSHRETRPVQSNPGVLTFMANSSKKKKYNGAKRKKNSARPNRKKKYNRKARKNGSHVHRNPPQLFAGRKVSDILKGTAEVLGGFAVTNIVPETLAPTYNTGGVGYLLNALAAGGAAMLVAWLASPNDGWMVLMGGTAAIFNRGIEDLTGTSVVDATTLQSLMPQVASGAITPAAAVAAATVPASATGLPASSTGVSGYSQRRWSLRKGMSGSYQKAGFNTPQGQPFPGQAPPMLNAGPAAPAPPANGKSTAMPVSTGTSGFADCAFYN